MPDPTPDVCPQPSTTWAWRKVKINPHPQGTGPQAPLAVLAGRRRQSIRSGVVILEVSYRGGAEDAWMGRLDGGRWWRLPGWLCLTDALTRLGEVR
jgi:hypothetical protein